MEDSSSYLMLELLNYWNYYNLYNTYNIRTFDGELVFIRQSTRYFHMFIFLYLHLPLTSDTHTLCFFV